MCVHSSSIAFARYGIRSVCLSSTFNFDYIAAQIVALTDKHMYDILNMIIKQIDQIYVDLYLFTYAMRVLTCFTDGESEEARRAGLNYGLCLNGREGARSKSSLQYRMFSFSLSASESGRVGRG